MASIPLRFKRHIGSAATAPALAEGEPAYIDPQVTANDDSLSIGSTVAGAAVVRTLVSNQRQVELVGAQTITGTKTIDIANLKITGGSAGQVPSTDGSGNLSWITGAGFTGVITDASLTGNGTAAAPLAVAAVDGGTF